MRMLNVSLLLLAATMTPAMADSGIQVVRAWARAPAGGGPAAMYFTLHDFGPADRLTSVSTDAAGMAMLHESSEANGMDSMRMLAAIDLPAGGTVTMRPGGLHVMLMDMNRVLAAGQTLHATLTFDHAPPITVAVPVLPPGSPGPQ
jgi:copper(I)-binding protein